MGASGALPLALTMRESEVNFLLIEAGQCVVRMVHMTCSCFANSVLPRSSIGQVPSSHTRETVHADGLEWVPSCGGIKIHTDIDIERWKKNMHVLYTI